MLPAHGPPSLNNKGEALRLPFLSPLLRAKSRKQISAFESNSGIPQRIHLRYFSVAEEQDNARSRQLASQLETALGCETEPVVIACRKVIFHLPQRFVRRGSEAESGLILNRPFEGFFGRVVGTVQGQLEGGKARHDRRRVVMKQSIFQKCKQASLLANRMAGNNP
ncbi:hypothetical protein A9Q89_12920 [Gammaproteobacteria bacterium 53_120_T64]|nr:hypothetical protein A9Q89_12920 [Gammaproteobacteria bacterium 53_120_T64]